MIGALGDGAPALLAFSSLAIGYLIGVVELVRRRGAARSLTAAGRMSLTAYVAEGMLAGVLFNGYGLGLYGEVGDLARLTLAIYAAVHGLCLLWSRTLGQGPLERLLRAATHAGALSRRTLHRAREPKDGDHSIATTPDASSARRAGLPVSGTRP